MPELFFIHYFYECPVTLSKYLYESIEYHYFLTIIYVIEINNE